MQAFLDNHPEISTHSAISENVKLIDKDEFLLGDG